MAFKVFPEPFNFQKLLGFTFFLEEPVRLGMQIANVKQRQIWFPRVGNQIWACTLQKTAPTNHRRGLETSPMEDCNLLLQTADVAGDEEQREVVYDWVYLFATPRYQLKER